MSKNKVEITYTFIDQNTPEDVERVLRELIIEKLLSIHTEEERSIAS